MVHNLIIRSDLSFQLRYLVVMLVDIPFFVKLFSDHNSEVVVELCFWLGMVDKSILKLTALIYFAFNFILFCRCDAFKLSMGCFQCEMADENL